MEFEPNTAGSRELCCIPSCFTRPDFCLGKISDSAPPEKSIFPSHVVVMRIVVSRDNWGGASPWLWSTVTQPSLRTHTLGNYPKIPSRTQWRMIVFAIPPPMSTRRDYSGIWKIFPISPINRCYPANQFKKYISPWTASMHSYHLTHFGTSQEDLSPWIIYPTITPPLVNGAISLRITWLPTHVFLKVIFQFNCRSDRTRHYSLQLLWALIQWKPDENWPQHNPSSA